MPLQGLPRELRFHLLMLEAQETGSIPGLGRSPGEGNGNPLQYSCLGNPTNRGAWWAAVHRAAKELDTPERLNNTNIREKNLKKKKKKKIYMYN